jgi:hypothetical protein
VLKKSVNDVLIRTLQTLRAHLPADGLFFQEQGIRSVFDGIAKKHNYDYYTNGSAKMPEKEIKLTDDLTRSVTHERPRPQGSPPLAQGTSKPTSGGSGSSSKKRK